MKKMFSGKNCQRCGSIKLSMNIDTYDGLTMYHVSCNICDTHTKPFDTEKQAAEHWNHRVPSGALNPMGGITMR